MAKAKQTAGAESRIIESDENPATDEFRDRLLEVRKLRAGEVLPHPKQHKIHPEQQDRYLRASLRTTGKIDFLRAYYSARNGGKLTYFDGHDRRSINPNEQWNIAIYDLSDEEADVALATFDEIGKHAIYDDKLTESLLDSLNVVDDDLRLLLDDLSWEVETGATASSDGKPDKRQLNSSPENVKAVFAVNDLAIIERAIQMTLLKNRGAALVAICTKYLDEERQFHS